MAVLGLERERVRVAVPARGRGRRPSRRDVDRQRDTPSKAISSRTRSTQPRLTSSASTPPVASGWTNATSSPKAPRRGLSSTSSAPPAASRSSSSRDVVDLERDVMHSGPALGEELARPASPAERREQLDAAARRPASTRPRRPGRRPSRDARARRRTGAGSVSTASSRSATATPRWWMPEAAIGAMLRCRMRPRRRERIADVKLVRIAAARRRRVLLAGCGGGGGCGESNDNGVAARPPTRSSPTATAAAKSATPCTSPAAGRRARASHRPAPRRGQGRRRHVDVERPGFDLVRVGHDGLLQGRREVLESSRRRRGGELFNGKWLSRRATTGSFASFTSLTDPRSSSTACSARTGTLDEGRRDDDRRPAGDRARSTPRRRARSTSRPTGEPYPLKLERHRRQRARSRSRTGTSRSSSRRRRTRSTSRS